MNVDAAHGYRAQLDRLFSGRRACHGLVFIESGSTKKMCMANLPECASGGDGILCRVILPFGMERV
jgi:hypothetical protein